MQFLERILSVAYVLWMDEKTSLFCSHNQSNINFKKYFCNDFRNCLSKRPKQLNAINLYKKKSTTQNIMIQKIISDRLQHNVNENISTNLVQNCTTINNANKCVFKTRVLLLLQTRVNNLKY